MHPSLPSGINNHQTIYALSSVTRELNQYIQIIQMKAMSLWNLSFTMNDLSDAPLFDATRKILSIFHRFN